MIKLDASLSPRERCDAIETSARQFATRADIVERANRIAEAALRSAPTFARDATRYGRRLVAEAILEAVSRAPWKGATSTQRTGQWVDTSVAHVLTHGGDCVARTHAMLALLYAIGFRARARWIVTRDELDHVAPEVFLDGWTWCDPLNAPARLGITPQGVVLNVHNAYNALDSAR